MRNIAACIAAIPLVVLPATTLAQGATSRDAGAAHAFVERMNAGYKAEYVAPNAAEWVAETYITDDTQMLTARANEAWLKWLAGQI